MLTNSTVPALYVSIKNGRFRVYDRERNSEVYYDTLEGTLRSIWQATRTFDKIVVPEWRFAFDSHDETTGDVRIILSGMLDNGVVEDIICRLATYVDYCTAQNQDTLGSLQVFLRLYDKQGGNGRKYAKCYMTVCGTPVRSRYVTQIPPDDWEKPFGLDWVVIPQHNWVDSAFNRVKVTSKERLAFIAQLADKVNKFLEVSNVPF